MTSTPLEYKERREHRAEVYERLAAMHRRKADGRYNSQRAIGDMIPMGQPILVGHHSERRHRADLKRRDNHISAMSEHLKKAEYYERKAESVRNNKAIYLDDPEAAPRLEDKIAGLEAHRIAYKAFNKTWKSKGLKVALEQYPGNQEAMAALITRYNSTFNHATQQHEFKDRGKLPSYMLSSVSAAVVRYRKQLEATKHLSSTPDCTLYESPTVTIKREEGRVSLHFTDKPDESIRSQLRRSPLAFKWSPSSGTWTRKLNVQMTSDWWLQQVIKVVSP